jgi:hypothetical protein
MNMAIGNAANYAFTNISIAKTDPSLGGLVSYAPSTYGGIAISASNPLPIGSDSSGLYDFSSGGSTGGDVHRYRDGDHDEGAGNNRKDKHRARRIADAAPIERAGQRVNRSKTEIEGDGGDVETCPPPQKSR